VAESGVGLVEPVGSPAATLPREAAARNGNGGAELLAWLEAEVGSGGRLPGSRLPPERQLAQRLGVTRNALRKALGVLEAQGRVVRHVGRGTFVASRQHVRAGRPGLVESSPAEVMSVRIAIEPQLMPLAVAAARPADLERMEQCLVRARAATTFHDFELWDAAIHQAMAEATHNGLASAILRVINSARDQPYWGTLKERTSTPERLAQSRREHEEIVDAIRERDAQHAQAAMWRHLHGVRLTLLGTGAAGSASLP